MSQVLPLNKVDAVAEAMASGQFGPSALQRRIREVREHYDRVSRVRTRYIEKNEYYLFGYNKTNINFLFIIPNI